MRPTAPADKRFASVYLFGAVRVGTDEAFALVMPFATAAVMRIFLQEFSTSLAPNAHAVLVLDKAGWHTARRLRVPENISFVLMPAYSPELNPSSIPAQSHGARVALSARAVPEPSGVGHRGGHL